MRHGMSPSDAVIEVLKRVSRNYGDDRARLEQFDLRFYALRKDGAYAGGSLWNGAMRRGALARAQFAVNDGGRGRLENCVFLLERK
jgi:N4-(beta-N-acetylglucosaminyl)-L-asparaginase